MKVEKVAIDIYDGEAYFNDSELGHLSKVDGESVGNYKVKVLTISSLIKKYNISSIGLIKMDVEGKEYDLMKSCSAWISIVKNLIVEIHDPKIRIRI